MAASNLTILGVLTGFREGKPKKKNKTGKGKHKREMAQIVRKTSDTTSFDVK